MNRIRLPDGLKLPEGFHIELTPAEPNSRGEMVETFMVSFKYYGARSYFSEDGTIPVEHILEKVGDIVDGAGELLEAVDPGARSTRIMVAGRGELLAAMEAGATPVVDLARGKGG